MSLLLQILLFIALFSILKLFIQRDIVTGTPPHLEGSLLNGRIVSLQSYQGKPLLLHFWATWCKICKFEEQSISDISNSHQVLTIAMKSGDNIEIQSYLDQHKLSFPVIVDEEGVISDRFHVTGVPTSFIIGPKGIIQYSEVGFTSDWGLRFRLWLSDN